MANYYIIAAGGTGAMCAKSFIYMAAAGCADKLATYHILLVDKDRESDSVTSCMNLLKEYNAMRVQLGQVQDTFTMPEIVLHEWNFTAEIVAEYHKNTNRTEEKLDVLTLNKLLNPDDDETIAQILASVYTPEELDTDLDKGFYGHPNIGAPVFDYVRHRFLEPRQDKEGKLNFMAHLIQTLQREKAYVYLFGSLFGGTGATVLPNVVRALRSLTDPTNINDHLGQDRLVLGGSIVMPYFRLPHCPENSVQKKQKVLPVDSKFQGQTQEALAYYHESELLKEMMNMVLVGSPMLDVTSEIYARGGSQTQHYHIVPLVAAAAANRFFAGTLGNMAAALQGNTVKPLGELILWKASYGDTNNAGIFNTLTMSELGLDEEYEKLLAFLRFSVVVAFAMRKAFEKTEDELMTNIEVLGTFNQMERNQKKMELEERKKPDMTEFYKDPVTNAGAVCRGFISFLFDVGLSGYDWTHYRGTDATKVNIDGQIFYNYTLKKGVASNAQAYFVERWMDMVNLDNLHTLLLAESTEQILKSLTLNEIESFEMLDKKRPGVVQKDYDHYIGTVYFDALEALGIVRKRHLFGEDTSKRSDRYFCEIYDKVFTMCGGKV